MKYSVTCVITCMWVSQLSPACKIHSVVFQKMQSWFSWRDSQFLLSPSAHQNTVMVTFLFSSILPKYTDLYLTRQYLLNSPRELFTAHWGSYTSMTSDDDRCSVLSLCSGTFGWPLWSGKFLSLPPWHGSSNSQQSGEFPWWIWTRIMVQAFTLSHLINYQVINN